MGKIKNAKEEDIPQGAIRLWECVELKKSFKKGDKLKIITPIWTGSHSTVRKKVDAVIDGVYPNGVRLCFHHKNWHEPVRCYRWLSYTQIIIEERSGKMPFVDIGHRGELK